MRSAQELMPYETWFGFRNSGFNSENFFRWEGCKLPIPFIIVALLAERGGKASSEYWAHPIGIHSAASSAHPVTRPAYLNRSKPVGLMLCQQCSDWSGSTQSSQLMGFVGRGEVRKLASLGLGSPNSDHPASL